MTTVEAVPADPSSPIPATLTQLAHADPLRPADAPGLLAYLAAVHDPRRASGRRHPLVAILAMAAAAVLAGARSMTAIAEWAADAPQPVRAALGARRDAPDRWAVPAEATIRRTLARVDPTALAAVIGAWLADRDRPAQQHRRRAVAVDGKTLRGAKRGDGRQVHLLAAMDHATRAVLAQRHVDGAPGEVPGFAPLLADLDLAGVVVTADALQTHATAAEFLVTGKQAHYLFTVKANQPTLLDRCAQLAWQRVPVLDRTRDRAHGRVELRTLKAVTVHHFGLPHAAQVVQVTRKARELGTRRWRTVVVYAVTSLAHAQASPARLADLLRGHWSIENGLHWVRDVTFAEDHSQLRTGSGPQVMACLRNLAIGALSRAGPVNLAAALRHHARDPRRPLATLEIAFG
ncbi:MAG: ISAs1 family transposase [Sporichthyaceae bacterium]|nr:ISAs1 family transposase [Sporichthyaceae bacterium]